MVARKSKTNVDPVLPDQGGRAMPADPADPAKRETIRRRAYELYEQRGRKDGYDLQDWLDAEAQFRADALDSQLIGNARA